ncbi:hypothetical protein, partial [Rhodococcus sp. KRD162]|uniref:hypothetical protein n=1 Tax=Rhodococcus sp. KRD162 TaxID=2729725 RepID=UPI0019D06E93
MRCLCSPVDGAVGGAEVERGGSGPESSATDFDVDGDAGDPAAALSETGVSGDLTVDADVGVVPASFGDDEARVFACLL